MKTFLGIGLLSSGIYQLWLGTSGLYNEKLSAWDCLLKFHSIFFLTGFQVTALMLVMISVDRLIAVRWCTFYWTLSQRLATPPPPSFCVPPLLISFLCSYAKIVIGSVYGYVAASLVVIFPLSKFTADPNQNIPAICVSTQVATNW